ncbi:galactose-1-epimerase [Tolumonas lignilytica]|uniref:galactose-1-epimerase n=1 Tax=Tolumonas lignilytica TaxID=1283284 RepID=UPI0023516F19|nr:galactose-1-epimerase [Tolumonas lignilytica]
MLTPQEAKMQHIRLHNPQGMTLELMTTGAALLSLQVPVGNGQRNVLLGCRPEDYARQHCYLNAMVGRFANRIADAQLTRQGTTYPLTANQGTNCLHGGVEGFDRRELQVVDQQADRVTLQLHSVDGDQGFPGDCDVTLTYALEQRELVIDIQATVNQPCPVNLTSHAYFNLDGKRSDIRHHRLQVNASHYLPIDAAGIPLSAAQPVEGALDFREERCLQAQWLAHPQLICAKGLDHCYLPDVSEADPVAARLTSSDGQLVMEVLTNQPGLQIYTGNYLAGEPSRENEPYHDYEGIALEAQQLPDSPNRPELGDPWLLPGQTYHHQTRYRFISE